MFLPTDSSKNRSPMPADTQIAASDWLILASFWHPVGFARDVGDTPVAAKLLDVALVLYRTSAGISVARDVCPHRGTRLSRGRVVDDQLVCPMHGLHFDAAGQCRRIPSIADPRAHIPASLRLRSVRTETRYGIVWACLSGEPLWPLPVWRGIADPTLEKLYFTPDVWKASAPRHVENFNDLTHFPWVHTESFGGDTDDAVAPYEVEHTDYGLSFSTPYTENFNRFPDGVAGSRRDVTYSYELTFPFSTLLVIAPKGSNYVQYFADTVCPVSAHESLIFQLCTDTTGAPDIDHWTQDQLTINREDRPLVEGQFPQALPLDVRDEMHIPADRMSIAYRRALATKFGLGAPVAA
jgi:vanillate O-demethylase monooxygenase subunit